MSTLNVLPSLVLPSDGRVFRASELFTTGLDDHRIALKLKTKSDFLSAVKDMQTLWRAVQGRSSKDDSALRDALLAEEGGSDTAVKEAQPEESVSLWRLVGESMPDWPLLCLAFVFLLLAVACDVAVPNFQRCFLPHVVRLGDNAEPKRIFDVRCSTCTDDFYYPFPKPPSAAYEN
ncbi:ABC transporter type-1, variant 2 [Cymbomonas tetramitiformis]|uniref:ABC transporter type-1, variant 2 n=1 Tax=Cymbomonas tetramitiformis TaxID=36881 RepID=A0AAE0BXJ9_9CHLO|nr:ABC transporter type-1, variant 2 [Cymbomonas tetramitiformis]